MTRFHEGKTRRVKPGRSSKAQWLPPTAGLRDWGTQLAAADAERIEVAVGKQLASLHYPSRFERFNPAVCEQVAKVHETFTRNALAASRTLARDWSC